MFSTGLSESLSGHCVLCLTRTRGRFPTSSGMHKAALSCPNQAPRPHCLPCPLSVSCAPNHSRLHGFKQHGFMSSACKSEVRADMTGFSAGSSRLKSKCQLAAFSSSAPRAVLSLLLRAECSMRGSMRLLALGSWPGSAP